MSTRGVRITVGVLGGISAVIAGVVGAFSLTRIAGDYLGFPDGLEWTLTGAVDVAGIAGGVMWTAFDGRVRAIGRPMNMVCTAVSGIGVGVDHATHAGQALDPGASPTPWPFFAFMIGLFIPLLFTWLIHALALIGDQAVSEPTAGPERKSDDRTASMTPSPPVPPVPLEHAEMRAVSAAPEPARTPTPELVPRLRSGPVMRSAPSPIGVTSTAREWLREHWTPGMKPAALTAGLAAKGVHIQRQAASKNMQWARSELGARGAREEVSA